MFLAPRSQHVKHDLYDKWPLWSGASTRKEVFTPFERTFTAKAWLFWDPVTYDNEECTKQEHTVSTLYPWTRCEKSKFKRTLHGDAKQEWIFWGKNGASAITPWIMWSETRHLEELPMTATTTTKRGLLPDFSLQSSTLSSPPPSPLPAHDMPDGIWWIIGWLVIFPTTLLCLLCLRRYCVSCRGRTSITRETPISIEVELSSHARRSETKPRATETIPPPVKQYKIDENTRWNHIRRDRFSHIHIGT